jgi:HlyD family secretion protein
MSRERSPLRSALLTMVLGASVALHGCAREGHIGDDAGTVQAASQAPPSQVTALGRLEPGDGIIRLAGPSRPSVVIAKLLVEEGDWVDAGQAIAELDTRREDEAKMGRARVELTNAETELRRVADLFRQGLAAESIRDGAQLRVDVAKADLGAARFAADLDTVRAPVRSQVITVHAHSGERVGPDGIAELAETHRMYAVAEVYETEIGRVRVGQRATATSPALTAPLTGTIDRIAMKVGKMDVLDVDPAARIDARVVEVQVKLDDSARAAALSNLQVTVAIDTE